MNQGLTGYEPGALPLSYAPLPAEDTRPTPYAVDMVRIRPTHLIVGVLVGIGFVELGMTGLLVAFGGDHTAVVAGVLLERALTFLPPIVLGIIFGTIVGVDRRGNVAPGS